MHLRPVAPARPRRSRRAVTLALVVPLLLAACTSAESEPSPAADPPPPSDDGSSDADPGDAAGDDGSGDPGDDGTAGDARDGDLPDGRGDDVRRGVTADGREVQQGTATVPTDTGGFELTDANVALGIDPATGEPTVAGTARVPFPDEGVFADAVVHELPVGQVGAAYGRDLAHLSAHLNDDRWYLYFAFDGGLDVEIPGAGEPGLEALPPRFAVPTGRSAVMVVDPAEGYLYVGTDCPDLSDDGDDRDADADDRDRDVDDDRDRDERDGDNDNDNDAYLTLDPADLPLGQECGIGFSPSGAIPAPGAAGGDGFSGHVVVDGVVPLYAGIELDGSVVVALGAQGARTVGWGDVLATVPLIDDLVDVRIPLSEATVEVQAEQARIGVAYSGSVGGSDPTYELPLVGVPITIPATGAVRWDARLGFVADGDRWTIDPESVATASGELGLGLGTFGELVGVDLDDVVTQEAAMRIDRDGVQLTGSMSAQLHPSVATGGATEVELLVAPGDWRQSRFGFTADVDVLGHRLAEAHVVLDAAGLQVAGLLDVGALRVEVGGAITGAGVELTGRSEVEIRLDGLAEASRTASAALDRAITEVERLDTEIDAAREQVRERRRNRDAAFVAARDGLDRAIASLDEIDAKVATHEARIAELEGKIEDEKRWYDTLGPVDKAAKWAGHTARLTGWRTEIGTRRTAIVTQRDLYRPAAVATLEGAKDLLDLIQAGLDALPVDTDPKVATLLATRAAAVGALTLAREGVELFEIEGTLRGHVEVRLATDGVSGSFSGEVCGTESCTTLAAGRLVVGAEPEVCVELPGLGEQCLAL